MQAVPKEGSEVRRVQRTVRKGGRKLRQDCRRERGERRRRGGGRERCRGQRLWRGGRGGAVGGHAQRGKGGRDGSLTLRSRSLPIGAKI